MEQKLVNLALPTEAPGFTRTRVNGEEVSLSDYRNRRHVVLVFNRGFTWPYCRRHMAQLRQEYDQFVDQNAEVIVVGPEDRDTFARHWQRHAYPFVGLSDPRHQVANLYGQEVKLLKLGRLPTLVVVDRHGRVRYQHHGHSMRDIPDNEEILDLLRKLNEEADPPAGPGGVEATGDFREE